MFRTKTIVLFLLLIPFAATNSSAQVYDTATFSNPIVTISDATTIQVRSDVLEGGVVAGTLFSTLTYGGGTNPFNFPNWSGGANFDATLNSTPDTEVNETADGVVDFLLIPNAGWQSSGLSVFSSAGTNLGNPVYANVVSSSGSGTISDALQGLSNELIGNFDDGDTVVNGSNIVFLPGSDPETGIASADHASNWSYDSAGSTNINFDFQAGPIGNVSLESIRLDASLTQVSSVPEPGSLAILGLLAGAGCMRRRRR